MWISLSNQENPSAQKPHLNTLLVCSADNFRFPNPSVPVCAVIFLCNSHWDSKTDKTDWFFLAESF